jgi:16S rRNA (guanine527-N7)-methyltransferase
MADFSEFIAAEHLTPEQAAQFEQYLGLLLVRNEQINLTAITKPANIIAYHFQDSLYVDRMIPMAEVHTVVDIGTGAGFPGLPLKIKYPHLKLVLIEVTYKKVMFLQEVITALGLQDVTIYSQDWRTFLRTTDEKADLFVTRAALQTEELLRMFKPASPYKDARLVYWAGAQWQPADAEKMFVHAQKNYVIKGKRHQLVEFKKS